MKNAMDKKTSKKSKKTRMAVNSTASKKEYKQLEGQKNLKQKKLSSHMFAKVFMTIVLILIAIVLISTSEVFNITEILVEGNRAISNEQIISFSGIEKGTNLFAISKKETVNKIKENSYVNKVQVKRCLPNKIKLMIEERQVQYALPFADAYVYIDEQGYILEISNNAPNVPMILGFSTDLSKKENHQLEQNDLNKMKSVIKIMEMATNHEMEHLITKIDISDEENYAIYLDTEGKIAYLGKGTELNTRFLYIKAILKEQQGKTGKIFVNMDLNSEYVYFSEEQL